MRPVLQYDGEGNFVAEYPGIREAQRQTGILSVSIVMVCRGRVPTAGGFVWKYKV